VGGIGSDTFNIYSLKVGTIFGAAGDDVFRFGRGEIGFEYATVDGGSGDDFFGVHGKHVPNLIGGAGFDRVSFRVSDRVELNLRLNNYEGIGKS